MPHFFSLFFAIITHIHTHKREKKNRSAAFATSFLKLRGLVRFTARRATAAELEVESIIPILSAAEAPTPSDCTTSVTTAAAAAGPTSHGTSKRSGDEISQDSRGTTRRGGGGGARREGSTKGAGAVAAGDEVVQTERKSGVGREGAGEEDGGGGGCREEQALLDLEAKVCRSILGADITELQFLEACPRDSYVKEFSVWNK